MKSAAIFQEYIWLVNTIFKAKRISLSEINRRWVQTEMSEGIPMSRSKFNRHKDAIQDIFGLYIDCDLRGGYKYYIGNAYVLEGESIQNWMLSTLQTNNIISECKAIHDRIVLESIPSGGDCFHKVIDAMKRNVCIVITYKRYTADEAKTLQVEPYCVRLFRRRWYMVCRLAEHNVLRVYSLDRVLELSLTDQHFDMPADFRADDYFGNAFGIFVAEDEEPQRIVLRCNNREACYMRDLPIHHTQREIQTTANFTDFEVQLCPTWDFVGYLLSRGTALQVLQPRCLHERMVEVLRTSLEKYREI